MFDGSAKLASKDFDVKSGQSPALTGKGGQVTDLKSAEPDLNKTSPATQFGLSGTKLSGETSNPATTKQSPVLLASAASAKTSADTASVSTAKFPANTAAAAKTAVSETTKATKYTCSGPFNASGAFPINPCQFAGSFSGVLTLKIYDDDTGEAQSAGSWKSTVTGGPAGTCSGDTGSFDDTFPVTISTPNISFSGGEGIPHQTFTGTLGDDFASGTLTFTIPLSAGSASTSVNLKCGTTGGGGTGNLADPPYDKMSCFLWVFNCKDMSKVKYQKVDGELFIKGVGDENEISFDDVKQGGLRDCFFIASLATMARQHPELIKDMIKENPDGTYSVTFYEKRSFWEFGEPEYTKKTVTVDGEFPINTDTNKPEFARYGTDTDGSKHELWGMILEKAYAEYLGSYNTLNGGGQSGSAMELLTGKDSSSYYWLNKPGITELADLDQKGYGMTLRTGKYWTGDKLESSHTYYILYVDKTNNTVTLGDPRAGYPPITLSEKEFQAIGSGLIVNPLK